jgi:hypothetical protein
MAEIDLAVAPRVCVTVNRRKNGTRLQLFSTLTTLGTPIDVTAQELRMESYFPADEATGEWLRKSAASAANWAKVRPSQGWNLSPRSTWVRTAFTW